MSYRRNAGSGMGEVIKWGLIGVAAYWVYTNFFSGTAATTTTAATPAATTPAATTTTATTPAAAISSFNTLDAIYSRMVSAATADNAASTLSADQWNVYLRLNSNITPPDPTAVFPGQDRTTLMTSAQYWASMSPYLAKNMGMSGLGFYGGLGVFMRRAVA
jgi:hypothetical protein